MSIALTLNDKEKLVEEIKKWIRYIKSEFQINDYSYSEIFEIGTHKNNILVLSVTTIPPKPLIEYKISVREEKLLERRELLIEVKRSY